MTPVVGLRCISTGIGGDASSRRCHLGAVLTAVALAACLARSAPAQEIRVRTPWPGDAGRRLAGILAAPHRVVRDTGGVAMLRRDSVIVGSIVFVGSDATVAGRVQGSVVVVGGDLFLRPGARVEGDAIAFGGGYYDSLLGEVRGARLAFRDGSFAVTDSAGVLLLDYRPGDAPVPIPVFALPGVYGLRIPSYDRVNGLSLPFAPEVTLGSGRLVLRPSVTYRSDLGEIDPGLTIVAEGPGRLRARLDGRRGTFTNDAWIWNDLRNSLGVLVAGRDTRNYYRADRLEGELALRPRPGRVTWEPFIGASTEDAWSVGPELGARSAPYSFLDRRDAIEGALRPNPAITPGRITSGMGGARLTYAEQDVVGDLSARVEVPLDVVGDAEFVQTTLDGGVAFPTFRGQRFRLDAHAVLTTGDLPPPQRFVYLGGSGTLPTYDLLEFGGDQLAFVESRYVIPVNGVRLPFVGSPVLTLRHMIGAAGPRSLPQFEQNVGLRVALGPIRVDFVFDPRTGDSELGVAPNFAR
ncbi:MAG TPA: hypothetical protein VNA89_10770 [Gemmatimonadaceae bacterium]|nr:hypothetical protein [Gemmatimonadaceae bacterium]